MNKEPQVQQTCNDQQGMLPACAPLANPYVPYQQSNPQIYQAAKGMIRGTMFPGLDLPFMNMVNQKEKSDTLQNRLQMYHFAISELGLYLDTHREDKDAIDLFNQYVEQYGEIVKQYENKHGSLTQMGAALSGKYDWLNDPWPWDYNQNKEG